MDSKAILARVDHTLLKAFATYEDIKKICETAVKYGTASVCIPPSFVKRVFDEFGERLTVCTVIGFPLGYHTTDVKLFETSQALSDGAKEIDMVINIGDAKEGSFDKITEEIRVLKRAVGDDRILKVIIETCYLTDDEKIALCKCVTDAGADFIKTSTGFGTDGATFADVELFKKHVGPNVKVKAAGGMKTIADIEKFVELGADRLGTSSAVSLLEGAGALDY